MNISREGDCNVSGKPKPGLNQPYSFWKKGFFNVQKEPHLFQFVLPACSPATGHHWKEPNSAFFASPLWAFIDMLKILPKLLLLQAWQSQFSQPFITSEILQLLNVLWGPLLLSLQYAHASLVSLLVSTELYTALQVRSEVVKIIQKQIFLNTSAMCAPFWTLLQPIFQSLGF